MNEEKTFTQDEVNSIVQKRLGEEKAKLESALAEKETELAAKEMRLTAREKLQEKGLSSELVDALNLSSAEAIDKSLTILETQLNEERRKATPPPPKYAAETGSAPMFGPMAGQGDVIKEAMGLSKK